MIRSQFYSSSYLTSSTSTSTSTSSADVLAKVSKVMEAQKTDAPKLNAALASDNTKLSGLGKLLNALSTFQSAAQSFVTTSSSTTATQTPEQLSKSVTELVDKYNSLNSSLTTLKQGDLKSDRALFAVRSQLSDELKVDAFASAPTLNLSRVGISVELDGSLKLDATKLQNAITANPEGVAALFSNSSKTGLADRLASQIQSMTGSSGGIEKEKTALNKDITTLTAKKSNLEKALTAQADALATLYSQQGTTGNSTGRLSLLDYI